jgi:hypothetical protein
VIQIELHPNSMNMEDDVSLRKSWEPLIHPWMNTRSRFYMSTFFSSSFCLSPLFTVVLSAVCFSYPLLPACIPTTLHFPASLTAHSCYSSPTFPSSPLI